MSHHHDKFGGEPSDPEVVYDEEDELTVADELIDHPDDERSTSNADEEHSALDPKRRASNPAPGEHVVPIRPLNVIGLVVALLFFCGPALAFVMGDRAESIENRALADAPSLSDGWEFIPNAELWAIDHLPLRSQAIRLGTEISQRVFDEPPAYGTSTGGVEGGQGTNPTENTESGQYPPIITGPDGTLFFGADVGNTCAPAMSMETVETQLNRIAKAVEDSGRTFVLAVAPDKSTFDSAKLPDSFAGKACMTERKDAFWAMLDAQGGFQIVDPRESLKTLQGQISEPIYKKYDTHWSLHGAYQFANDVATALDPGVAATTTSTVVGQTQLDGDLSVLLGTPQKDTYDDVRIQRPGVTLTMDSTTIQPNEIPSLTADFQHTAATTEDAPLIPGKTLILGDSFFEASRFMFPSYFADLTYVHNQAIGEPAGLAQIPEQMADSDVVVLEVVERSLAGGQAEILSEKSVEAIEKAMAANPK